MKIQLLQVPGRQNSGLRDTESQTSGVAAVEAAPGGRIPVRPCAIEDVSELALSSLQGGPTQTDIA